MANICEKVISIVAENLNLMRRSSHIQSYLIGVEYQNWRRTLDAYLPVI